MYRIKMERSNKEFAEKLFDILGNPHNRDIIRWSDSGDSFIILDTIEFAKSILEKYFKHKNFNSFVRQLNKYDFHKIKSTQDVLDKYGINAWQFRHAYFKKNREDLIYRIKRKKGANERRLEIHDFNGDMAEKSVAIQNQVLEAIKGVMKCFESISEEIKELKKVLLNEKVERSTLKQNSVLIYEDNLIFKSLISKVMQRSSFLTHSTYSMQEFDTFLMKYKYDLIIISSEKKDQRAKIREIRSFDSEAVIFLTGKYVDRDIWIEFAKLGIDEFVIKPFTEEILVALLRKHNLVAKSSYYE